MKVLKVRFCLTLGISSFIRRNNVRPNFESLNNDIADIISGDNMNRDLNDTMNINDDEL
jgi:hypothetical protein